MRYAKVNEEGTVIEFPYYVERSSDVPEDAVEVDTASLKPAVTWNIKLMYDEVIKNDDGTYVLKYTEEPKFNTLEDKQKWMKVAVDQHKKQNEKTFKAKISQLKTGYTDEEILSWDQQSKEAELYLLDDTSTVSLIQKIALQRGVSLSELATKISEKNALFNESYGSILGTYQKNKDTLDGIDLEDETTFSNIDLYGW